MEKELDALWGVVVGLAFLGLLFAITMAAATGPTLGERARLADSLVTNTQPTGVQWR